MKLNFANPATGQQKLFDIDDERASHFIVAVALTPRRPHPHLLRVRSHHLHRLLTRASKRMSQEVVLDPLGDEFKGYVARVTGGNDKQGFPMKQGVLLAHRVRLLLSDGHSCYRPRKSGERRRKSVRGCIVGPDIAVLALAIVKQGEADIPGLTDQVLPKRLGPKRATKIRRFFALDKTDDVRKYVIRREVASKKEGGKAFVKAPKIQRLVTPQRLQQCVGHPRRRRLLTSSSRRHLKSLVRRKKAEQIEQKRVYNEKVAKFTADKSASTKAKACVCSVARSAAHARAARRPRPLRRPRLPPRPRPCITCVRGHHERACPRSVCTFDSAAPVATSPKSS